MENQKYSLKELYPSYESGEFQNDFKKVDTLIENFENLDLKDDLETVKKVIGILEDLTTVIAKLFSFIELNQTINTTDETTTYYSNNLRAKLSNYAKTFTKIDNYLGNLTVDITKDNYLKEYAYFFKEKKEALKHILSEDAEEIIAKMQLSGSNAWEFMFSFLTSKASIEFNGEEKTLSEIRNLAYSPDAKLRKEAYYKELELYNSLKDPISFSINNIKQEVNTTSKMRGFDTALDQSLYVAKLKRETLDALWSSIEDYLPHFRRYFKHKAKLLGYEGGLKFYDLFASIGESDKTFTVKEAEEFLLKHFATFSKDLVDMAKEAFDNNYIDYYPRKGKVGGAFCQNLPYIKQSRILMNFDGSLSNVLTLAHELGHAYHGLHVENHLPLNWDYSMPVAETASIFNENLIMAATLKSASEKEKIALIESQVSDCAQIVVDIYSRFLFEREVFERRLDHFMMSEELEEIMKEAQKQTYGDGLDPETYHPFMWVCKPHYYSAGFSFYNYPYSFGGLFSRGLYAMYKENPDGFVEKYQELLRATTTNSCEDTAKVMGIDLTKKDFWLKSLESIKEQIDEFINLTSK
ncbi:MAG: M3 family oligoendopeptidase [Peptoniphilaceae bacterium]|uniref:M3 family oligoendopeptidase n=1 Tax=Parvimonas sp. TaxID=1944660 RepID=UPI0025DFDB01|nr:M3 family oligoendopeptidase [Parvimonas sp.]MCI5997293.1 M3 family oligoendopeptidase [Parvimonas sp.]MDD7765433.1 M3 family oligoendopeptidase [Peptoniphilaceae bacterium]MDY3050974.1 M3 family oligoendopeptidase [Parvimonas sp.]